MQATTSIIQNVSVPNNVSTVVKPPANCFRCTITFFDDSNSLSKGIVSSSATDVGYTFVNYFETDGAAPTNNTFQGQLNQTIVMDRRGIGYLVDEFYCQIKSTGGPCTFTFIWEIVV